MIETKHRKIIKIIKMLLVFLIERAGVKMVQKI